VGVCRAGVRALGVGVGAGEQSCSCSTGAHLAPACICLHICLHVCLHTRLGTRPSELPGHDFARQGGRGRQAWAVGWLFRRPSRAGRMPAGKASRHSPPPRGWHRGAVPPRSQPCPSGVSWGPPAAAWVRFSLEAEHACMFAGAGSVAQVSSRHVADGGTPAPACTPRSAGRVCTAPPSWVPAPGLETGTVACEVSLGPRTERWAAQR